jgi:DNA primase
MAFINKDFISDLTNQINIVDLISNRVTLKKSGRNYTACCPFHSEKTPSFVVSFEKQMYKCFSCQKAGGAIEFVMSFDNIDFKNAVETIANESGISVIYDEQTKKVNPKIPNYRDLMQKVCDFYIQKLKNKPNKAVSYCNKRAIKGITAKTFALGFAPKNVSLFEHFKDDPKDIKDLETMGLIKTNDNSYYDFFRDRLMFPIYDIRANVIAFGGRAFYKNAKAKYLNSPETPIFSKSNELYGLYQCRKYSRKIDYILVVEGYTDVLSLHQAGITEVVATLGTAITTKHLKVLSNTTNNIIFCFDGDKAGKSAAWRALQNILPEIKAKLVVKFLFLPDGQDPDSLIKQESAQAFKERIEKSYNLSEFLFNHIKDEKDIEFDTIEGKTLFLEKACELISTINYQTYKTQLIKGLALETGQNVDEIKTILNQQSKPNKLPSFAIEPNLENSYLPEDMPDIFINDEPQQVQVKPPPFNKSIAKMITLLLNHPILADDNTEKRLRNIKQSDTLLEMIRSAQINKDISKQELLRPFKNKLFYNELKNLTTLTPYLNQEQATQEFLSILSSIEKRVKQENINKQLSANSTEEQQQKIIEDIKKSKLKD